MAATEGSFGVDKVVDNISRLPSDLFGEVCQHILNFLQGLTRGVDSAEISDRLLRADVRLDQETLQKIIRHLLIIFRAAGKTNLPADDFVLRLQKSDNKWPQPSLQVLHKLWSEHGALVHAQQKALLMLFTGRLVDMQWKLGMAISSDTCRSLNSPYVSVLVKVAQPSGQICQKSFEMTIPQFQNFHNHFKEMAALMETV